jgi:hypothetical protein
MQSYNLYIMFNSTRWSYNTDQIILPFDSYINFFSMAQQPLVGQGLPLFRIHDMLSYTHHSQ